MGYTGGYIFILFSNISNDIPFNRVKKKKDILCESLDIAIAEPATLNFTEVS